MSFIEAFLFIFAVTQIPSFTAGRGNCPPPFKVYSRTPKCFQDYDCSHGKICCPNSANEKSCTEPAPYGGNAGNDKYSQTGGPGVYCNGVKCNPFEVCKLDLITKKLRCQRS